MTRTTPGSRVRARSSRASSPASDGVVCIFQLAAMITGRIADHARARPADRAGRARGGAGRRPPLRAAGSSSWRPATRSAPAPAGRPSDGGRAARRARRASPPASRAGRRRPAGRHGAARPGRPSASSCVDRRELAAGRRDRPLEVRRLGVDDPVELAAQRPRDLARLELEERRAGADPARKCRSSRRSSRSRRRGRAGPATRPAARVARAGAARTGASSGGRRRTRGGSAAGEAQRAAGQEATPQPGRAAVVGARRPSRTAPRAARRPAGPAAASAIRTASRRGAGPTPRSRARAGRRAGERGSRSTPARGRPPARAVAGRGRVDRRELGPQRGDEVAIRDALTPVRADRAAAPVAARGPRARRPGGSAGGQARAGSWWMGVRPGRRRRRGRAGRAVGPAGGQRRRTASPRQPAAASRVEPVVGEDDVDDARRRVPLERLDVVGEVEAARSRRPAWRRCRRRSAAPATPAMASRIVGHQRGPAGCS